MDAVTLAAAKKYAKALVDTIVGGDIEGLEDDVDELKKSLSGLIDSVDDVGGDVATVDRDGDLATSLILQAFRTHVWQNEDEKLTCEEGTATLTNTLSFPFNNSTKSIALAKKQKNTSYAVLAAVKSGKGNVGEVVISDKQVNGFKMAYTGGASSATVSYMVIGGIIE